jgi:ferredoxin-type protein NapH
VTERQKLALVGAHRPGPGHRIVRRVCQALALFTIVVAPLLGGYQRLDRNYLAAWDQQGWDLPRGVLERLPDGALAREAHEWNVLRGGGTAVEYFSIPILDPVAGLSAWSTLPSGTRIWIAWALPMLLALVAGRVFCGWFCPFGTLARLTEGALRFLPWTLPRFDVPTRRPLRFVLLAAFVAAGFVGAPGLLYLLLPHGFLQQSVYGLWLMGGGGAALGWLLGLWSASLIFGPTLYCATLCPTGAALSVGRRRKLTVLQVGIAEPERCGRHCDLCSRACWLALDPARGDPGPDCDGCARCFEVCPRDNLRLGWLGRRASREPPVHATTLLLVLCSLLTPDLAQAEDRTLRLRPRLLMEERVELGDVSVALALLDRRDVRLDADDGRGVGVTTLTLTIARGVRGAADERGRLPLREVYTGPVVVSLTDASGEAHRVMLAAPNAPSSTPRRALYRSELAFAPSPGDVVSVHAIEGVLPQALRFTIPNAHPAADGARLLWAWLWGALVFSGLLSLSLGVQGKRPPLHGPV